jgi:hypothetical protein
MWTPSPYIVKSPVAPDALACLGEMCVRGKVRHGNQQFVTMTATHATIAEQVQAGCLSRNYRDHPPNDMCAMYIALSNCHRRRRTLHTQVTTKKVWFSNSKERLSLRQPRLPMLNRLFLHPHRRGISGPFLHLLCLGKLPLLRWCTRCLLRGGVPSPVLGPLARGCCGGRGDSLLQAAQLN